MLRDWEWRHNDVEAAAKTKHSKICFYKEFSSRRERGAAWGRENEIVQMHKENYVNYTMREQARASKRRESVGMKPLRAAALGVWEQQQQSEDDDMNYSILSENVYLKFIKLWDLHTETSTMLNVGSSWVHTKSVAEVSPRLTLSLTHVESRN